MQQVESTAIYLENVNKYFQIKKLPEYLFKYSNTGFVLHYLPSLLTECSSRRPYFKLLVNHRFLLLFFFFFFAFCASNIIPSLGSSINNN